MHGRVEALRNCGETVIDFSIALSHWPAPAAVRERIAAMVGSTDLEYTAVSGALPLRQRLATKLRRENGIDAKPSEVIVTNGAKQAVYESLYVLTDPGDTIIVFCPFWPAYVATAQLLQLHIELVDLPERLDEGFLRTLPRAKLIVINNPHNPTGKVFSAHELSLLAEWMRRTGCSAIVDESYEKLLFEGTHRSLAASADWRALGIVTIFSASQSYAMMGWRAGFAVATEQIVNAMETLQGPITAAASALTQAAIAAAFESGEPYAMKVDYQERRDLVVAMLSGRSWLSLSAPDAGPYLWCDIRLLGCDTVAFAEELLSRHRVAIMPGDALGRPGFIRIGFIADDVRTLRQGINTILKFGAELANGAELPIIPLAR